MDEARFRADLLAKGYGEPSEVSKPGGLFVDDHSHDIDARGLILEGELSMTTAEGTTIYRPGDILDVPAGLVHSEKFGPDGAKFIVARRDPVQ